MFVVLLVIMAVLAILFYFAYWRNYIGPEEVGMITRHMGPNLRDGNVVAFSGEAGWQADLLLPGWHWIVPPLESLERYPRVRIPAGTYGLVISQVGEGTSSVFSRFKFPTITQGDKKKTPDFSILADPRWYVSLSGTKGILLEILPPGWTGIVHPGAFLVVTTEGVFGNPVGPAQTQSVEQILAGFEMNKDDLRVTTIPAEMYGRVEARDGKTPPSGSVATFPDKCEDEEHKTEKPEDIFRISTVYQDPHAFLERGYAGHQAVPLGPGTHLVNRALFNVTVDESTRVTTVGPNEVLVVIQRADSLELEEPDSSEPPETTFPDQTNQNKGLVPPGKHGVWNAVLGSGAYVIDPIAFEKKLVHTSVQEGGALKDPESVPEKLDFKLKPFELTTKDHVSLTAYFLAQIKIEAENAPTFVIETGGEEQFFTSILPALLRNALRAITQQMKASEIVSKREEIIKRVEKKLRRELRKRYKVELVNFILGDIDFQDKEVSEIIRGRAVAEEKISTHRKETEAEQERVKRDTAAGRADGARRREEMQGLSDAVGPDNAARIRFAEEGQPAIPSVVVVSTDPDSKAAAGAVMGTVGRVVAESVRKTKEAEGGDGDESNGSDRDRREEI